MQGIVLPTSLAAFLCGAALLATGCGRTVPTSGIDVHGLEQELQFTTHQRFISQGYDYLTKVSCGPSGTPNVYDCDVLVTNPRRNKHVEWHEIVLCRAPAESHGRPRCSGSHGDALQ